MYVETLVEGVLELQTLTSWRGYPNPSSLRPSAGSVILGITRLPTCHIDNRVLPERPVKHEHTRWRGTIDAELLALNRLQAKPHPNVYGIYYYGGSHKQDLTLQDPINHSPANIILSGEWLGLLPHRHPIRPSKHSNPRGKIFLLE